MSKPYYPVGRYACKVTGQALGQAGTGNPQFALRFLVMGQVDPADPSRYIPAEQQYERTHYRTITEKSIEYFIEDLKLLGFHGSSYRELDPKQDGFHDFRGLDIDMWCAHEKGRDGEEDREKWGIARQGGGDIKMDALESKKLRELDNLFGKHLKALGSNGKADNPSVATAKKAATPAGVTDEDIPF